MSDEGITRAIKAFSEWMLKGVDKLANVLKVSEQFPAAYDAAQDSYKNETVVAAIRSDKDTHFTGALAQNVKEDENLTGLGQNKVRIKRIKVQSDQNLDWDVYLWKTDTFDDTDLDIDSFCGGYKFSAAEGEQVAGANQYYYDSGPMEDIIYEDLDGTSELHVSVVNRNAVAKIAGATGELIVEIEWEPAA